MVEICEEHCSDNSDNYQGMQAIILPFFYHWAVHVERVAQLPCGVFLALVSFYFESDILLCDMLRS